LAHNIHRIKVKGTGVRARSNPEQEPNFWEMDWVSDDTSSESNQPRAQQIAPLPDNVAQVVQSIICSSTGQRGVQIPLQPNHPVTASLHPAAPQCQNELDLVSSFGKAFHYLDPAYVEPLNAMEQPKWSVSDAQLLQNEAEIFFEDFDFPDNIGVEIEDDSVFGDMLESLIS
jgi:hypothetical protein